MIWIVQIKDLGDAEHAGHFLIVRLVSGDRLTQTEIERVFFVVAGANQVSGVTLGDQLGDGPSRQDRMVVGVGSDRRQNFAGVRLAWQRFVTGWSTRAVAATLTLPCVIVARIRRPVGSASPMATVVRPMPIRISSSAIG